MLAVVTHFISAARTLHVFRVAARTEAAARRLLAPHIRPNGATDVTVAPYDTRRMIEQYGLTPGKVQRLRIPI